MGRAPGAVAIVIDSQSIEAADTVGKDSRGYDSRQEDQRPQTAPGGGHQGPATVRLVTPADMTDRNAAKEVLLQLRL